ncbi:MAG: hypothetical protein Q8865_06850, partial [Bacillota bacterium]|nr:hypothetical protein [Bacillota bacterium]
AGTKIPDDYKEKDKRSLTDTFNQLLSDVNFIDFLICFQIVTGIPPINKRPGYDKQRGVLFLYGKNDDSIKEMFHKQRVHTLIDAIIDNTRERTSAAPGEEPKTKRVKFIGGKVIVEDEKNE